MPASSPYPFPPPSQAVRSGRRHPERQGPLPRQLARREAQGPARRPGRLRPSHRRMAGQRPASALHRGRAAGRLCQRGHPSLLAMGRQHYRREDGTTTNELGEYRFSLRPLRELRPDAGGRLLSAQTEGCPPADDTSRLEPRTSSTGGFPGSSTCSSGPSPRAGPEGIWRP